MISKGKRVLGILGRVLKGVGNASTLGVVSAISDAKNGLDGGKGKHDYPKIMGYLVVAFIIFGVIFKNLEPEVANSLIKLLTKFGFFG